MNHMVTVSKLTRDLYFGMYSSLKLLIRFVVWQWRAKSMASTIKSFHMALGATIGRRVLVEKNVYMDAFSMIDDFTYINANCSIENTTIGKFCSIARGVMIGPAEHNYLNLSTHPFWYQPFYGFNVIEAKGRMVDKDKTTIQNDVWIGCNAIIRRGVTIQTGAVIGAGSLVTKNVGAYEIWGGVPAKKIKQRFDQATIKELLKLDWCSLPIQKIDRDIIPNIDRVNVETIDAVIAGLGKSYD